MCLIDFDSQILTHKAGKVNLRGTEFSRKQQVLLIDNECLIDFDKTNPTTLHSECQPVRRKYNAQKTALLFVHCASNIWLYSEKPTKRCQNGLFFYFYILPPVSVSPGKGAS